MGDSAVTTEFQVNQVSYGDTIGIGLWADGHFRQHLRYNATLAAQPTPVILPEFPILFCPLFSQASRREIKFWLDSHEKWHELLRPIVNITSADFSTLNWDKPAEWYDWQDLHAVEHQLLDRAFGVG